MTFRVMHLEMAGPARVRALLLDGKGQVRRVAERSMKGPGALARLCRDLGLDPEDAAARASAEWQKRSLARGTPLATRLAEFWADRPPRGRLT